MASIVDYLNSKGRDSSFAARQRLAQQYGISNYSGTATQNNLLLDKLQGSSSNFGSGAAAAVQSSASRSLPTPAPVTAYQAGAQASQPSAAYTGVSSGAQSASTLGSSAYQAAEAGAGYTQMIDQRGDPILVPKGQEQTFLNSGFTYPGQQRQTPVSIVTQPTTRSFDQSSSQNYQSSLPKSVEKVLDVLQDKIAQTPINPDVQISADLIEKFYQQAKAELDPYYGQLFKQAQEDLIVGFKQIREDLTTQERNLESNYGKNLENIQEDAAARGLTFSSIRDKNEQSLVEQTQAAIEAGRREAERRARELGTQGERQIGTANLPTLSGINEAPTPILNKPGVYSFAKPTGVRDLFKPIGSTTGKLEQDKLAAVQSRKLDLTNQERAYRGLNTI